jgi:RNA polymerase sigma-70 factor, ECF subfamily
LPTEARRAKVGSFWEVVVAIVGAVNRAHVLPWRDTSHVPTRPCMAASDRTTWTTLLDRMAAGDASACVDLYDRSATVSFSLIAHILGDRAAAEETLREVYVEIMDRARRGEHRHRDPVAWLLSMARSAAISRLRANPKAAVVAPAEGMPVDVHPALSALNADQRAILQMIYFGGLTAREAALRLGRPVEDVTTQLHAALTLLRTPAHRATGSALSTPDPSRSPHRSTRSGRYRVVAPHGSSPSPAS